MANARNTVRIIGGKWRGRKLSFPSVDGLRPSADRGRETLFNWLEPHLPNSVCLDLFAGSGCLGFEALSRGAATATLVDVRSLVIAQLQKEAAVLSATPTIVRADARNWLRHARQHSTRYDIIFLDPPFASSLLSEVLADACALSSEHGLIYIEWPTHAPAPQLPDEWTMVRQTTNGAASIGLIAPDRA